MEEHERLLNICKESLLKQYPDLVGIYAFGSITNGHFCERSDIDIAILPNPKEKIDPVKLWYFAQKLAVKTGRDIDLIDLNEATTSFRYEITTTGNLIYCSDESSCVLAESNFLTEYLQLNEDRACILEDFKKPA